MASSSAAFTPGAPQPFKAAKKLEPHHAVGHAEQFHPGAVRVQGRSHLFEGPAERARLEIQRVKTMEQQQAAHKIGGGRSGR